MRGEYRSRPRILLDLLRAVKEQPGIGSSALLARVNLSTDRLATYLEQALFAGLLAEQADPRSFSLTEPGQAMLTELDRLDRFMADFGMTL